MEVLDDGWRTAKRVVIADLFDSSRKKRYDSILVKRERQSENDRSLEWQESNSEWFMRALAFGRVISSETRNNVCKKHWNKSFVKCACDSRKSYARCSGTEPWQNNAWMAIESIKRQAVLGFDGTKILEVLTNSFAAKGELYVLGESTRVDVHFSIKIFISNISVPMYVEEKVWGCLAMPYQAGFLICFMPTVFIDTMYQR